MAFRQTRPGSPSRIHSNVSLYSLPVAAIFNDVSASSSAPASAVSPRSPETPSKFAIKARDVSETEQMLGPLMRQVQSAAQSRGCCMVVSQGTPNTHPEKHFGILVEHVLKALSPTAERALQIVADELAKKKQMQRLMMSTEDAAVERSPHQDDDGGEMADVTGGDGGLEASPALTNRSTKELSLDLRKALRSASSKRDVGACMTSRFAIYSSRYNGVINPPIHDRALTARGLEVRPPTQGSPSSARRPSSKLGVHSPDIPQAASSVRSRTASFFASSLTQQPNSPSPSQQRRAMLRRKSSMRLLDQLNSNAADPVAPLKRNGWGPEGTFLEFNGVNSYLSLPPIPKFDQLIKCFSIDFWFQTDCKTHDDRRTLLAVGDGTRTDVGMLFHIGLNWYSDYEEGIRVYIRDGSNRVIECIVPFPTSSITSGQNLHHFQLDVRNLEDGKFATYIDGQFIERLRFLQTEHPNTFTTWLSPLFVGGTLDDKGAPHHSLRGTVCEIRVRDHSGKPVVRWPLNGAPNPSGTLVEGCGAIPADHQETIMNVSEVDRDPTPVCPVFDGTSTILNLGPLGSFGDFLNHWGMEFTFRTTQSKKCMSLFGFTDSQNKMSEAGLILNAEPCMSKERYRFVEHNITFYTVDCNGHCASVLIRGSDRNNVVDGKWHTITFKVTDSETGRFEALIDGLKRECICVVREAPKVFVALRDWVCIGGHNVRSWKVKNLFEGSIKEASIMVRGERFAHLTFEEGPGSAVAQDMSGRHNNGLWQDATTKESLKHTMNWVHQNNEADEDDGGEALNQSTALATTAAAGGQQVTLHRHNDVSFAVVCFGCAVVNGKMEEVIVDVIHNQQVDIEISYEHAKGADPQGFGLWMTLPKSVYTSVESVPSMRDAVANILSSLSEELSYSHTVVVCKIGDATTSVVGLVGPNGSGTMSYDPKLQKWVPHVVATGTLASKRNNTLNSMALGASRALLEMSALPHVVVRLGPINQPHRHVTATQLCDALQQEGAKWKLGLALHSLLLNTEFSTALHFVSTIPQQCNHNEVLSVVAFQEGLMESARDRCAVFIQRNWRGKLGRLRVERLIEENHVRKLKVEDIIHQRKSNPIVAPKKILKAIVISIHGFQNPTFPPPRDAGCVDEVARGLAEQGYAVDRVRNPTRAQLSKVLGAIDGDAGTFVYIHGYGGSMSTRYPVPFGLYTQQLSLEEENARCGIQHAAALELRLAFQQIIRERHQVEEEVAAKKNKKKKRGASTPRFISSKASTSAKQQAALLAQQQQQQASEFLAARNDLEHEEGERRASDILAAEENSRAMLLGDLVQLSRSCSDFYNKQGKAAYYLVPSDCRALEPLAADLVPVEAVLSKALMHPAPPMGFQGVVVVDLQPIKGTAALNETGAGFLAASTGHHYTFDYAPGQVNALSWVVRKALMGYCPRLPLKSKDLFLLGAVEPPFSDDVSRDWYSFSSYVVRKMQVDVGMSVQKAAKADAMLRQEMPYVADLVPVRAAPLSSSTRENKKKDEEMRRETAFAHVSVDSSRATADPSHEVRSLFKLLNIVEVTQESEVTLVLADGNKGIDNVDLTLLQREIRASLLPGTEIGLRISPSGIVVTLLSHTADKPKLSQSLLTITNRGINWSVVLRPFGTVAETRIVRVEPHYTAKLSGTARKVHKQRKELLQNPYCGALSDHGALHRLSGGAAAPSNSAAVKLLSFNE